MEPRESRGSERNHKAQKGEEASVAQKKAWKNPCSAGTGFKAHVAMRMGH